MCPKYNFGNAGQLPLLSTVLTGVVQHPKPRFLLQLLCVLSIVLNNVYNTLLYFIWKFRRVYINIYVAKFANYIVLNNLTLKHMKNYVSPPKTT